MLVFLNYFAKYDLEYDVANHILKIYRPVPCGEFISLKAMAKSVDPNVEIRLYKNRSLEHWMW